MFPPHPTDGHAAHGLFLLQQRHALVGDGVALLGTGNSAGQMLADARVRQHLAQLFANVGQISFGAMATQGHDLRDAVGLVL